MKCLLSLAAVASVALAQTTDCFGTGNCPAMAYTMTNSPTGNELLAFPLSETGAFLPGAPGRFATGGNGNNDVVADPLFSQGAIASNAEGSRVFVPNANSDTFTLALVTEGGLLFNGGTFDSQGNFPQSIAFNEDETVLYVLNNGNTAQGGHVLAFFQLNAQQTLASFTAGNTRVIPFGGVANSFGSTVQPANPDLRGVSDVTVFPDGRVGVTQKQPDTLHIFSELNGLLSMTAQTTDLRPDFEGIAFGLEVDPNNGDRVAIVDATGSLGVFTGISGASSPTLQAVGRASNTIVNSETCWVQYTDNGEFAFTSSTQSGVNNEGFIQSYTISEISGAPTLLSQTAFTFAGNPTDIFYEADSNDAALYVLDATTGTVNSLAVMSGALSSQGFALVTDASGATLTNAGIQGLTVFRAGGDDGSDTGSTGTSYFV